MELFDRAKAVRLRSYHGKYLTAEEDEEHVTQSRDGSAPGARWNVEFVDGGRALRLLSCHGRYLAATADHFLLGATGKKVAQALPPVIDSSLEWEPLREGFQVKLKSLSGHFLRANGGPPPWRNSVTHDLPHRTATQDWVLWDVNIVQIQIQPPSAPTPAVVRPSAATQPPAPASPPRSAAPAARPTTSATASPEESPDWSSSLSMPSSHSASPPHPTSSPHNTASSPEFSEQQSFPSFTAPPQDRTIHYTIASDRGKVDDSVEWPSLTFVGTSVPELTRKLKQMTKLDDIIVCTRHPVNHRLSPLYLQLPPNNRTMWLVVVDADSTFGRTFDI